jgi:hypothetical protein
VVAIKNFGHRCPYCEMKGEEHLSSCKAAELGRRLTSFLDGFGEPTGAETYDDVFNLVLTAREIVFALDGFDPEFSVVCRPLVENLKMKLAPFEKL